MTQPNGDFIQQQIAFGDYLIRWFSGLYGEMPGVKAFKARAPAEALKWAPSRMIDEAEKMLEQYRQNTNGPKGKSSLFPVVIVAPDDDFIGTGADWGGAHTERTELQIWEGGSWYGHNLVMHDRRFQVVIAANEGDTAKALAAQLSAFIKKVSNRYFNATYTFGQYQVPGPIQMETNRIDWMAVKTDAKNMKILAADITVKCQVPHFDAPGEGEPNDGSTNNPPGYPRTGLIDLEHRASHDGEQWNSVSEHQLE